MIHEYVFNILTPLFILLQDKPTTYQIMGEAFCLPRAHTGDDSISSEEFWSRIRPQPPYEPTTVEAVKCIPAPPLEPRGMIFEPYATTHLLANV